MKDNANLFKCERKYFNLKNKNLHNEFKTHTIPKYV